MKTEIDIHNYPKRLRNMLRKLEESPISQRNRELILQFKAYGQLEGGLGVPRIERYMGVLKDWALLLNKDFDRCTKEDIMKAVAFIQDKQDYTAFTKSTYKTMLKRFFRWVKDSGDEQPEETRWIKTRIKMTEKKMLSNSELITEDEIKKAIAVAANPRDKAFISVLYESGARIGEIGSLQICNVSFDKYGATLNVEGKTGSRPIRIISSTAYLMMWLENHPFRNNPQAPLWVRVKSKKMIGMGYPGFNVVLRRTFRQAGIHKRCNPHLFRHSRSTFLADYLTEFQMNQYLGWIQGSRMPSVYVHMSGKKIDSSILAMNGITQPKEEKESLIKPKICPKCETINTPEANFCTRCAGILDVKAAVQLEEGYMQEKELKVNSEELMKTLLRDRELIEMFALKIKSLGLQDKVAC